MSLSRRGTIIVTGANGGYGNAIATQFLSSPESSIYKGVWGVRNPATANNIQKTNVEPHEIVQIDISTLESTRRAAAAINERVKSGELPPIRALVLNAALQITGAGQTFTNDGFEQTIVSTSERLTPSIGTVHISSRSRCVGAIRLSAPKARNTQF